MTDGDSRSAATRLVSRHVSEVLIDRLTRWQRVVPQERGIGIVFDVVLSASLEHLPMRDATGRWIGIADAATLGRPVNAMAVALSMNLSQTTVRRQATNLAGAGLLARQGTGFVVAPAILAGGVLDALAAGDAAALLRMIGVLADAGYEPAMQAVAAGVADLPAGVVERMLLGFRLRAVESFVELYGDITTGTVMATIIATNVRHITDDPDLAARYAAEDRPPPDAERRPVALRALARAMNLPFETVRRRVAGQVKAGLVRWQGEGVIVPTDVLLSEAQLENNRRILLHAEQMLAALARLC